WLQEIGRGWTLRPLGSTAYKLALVAAGRAAGYITRGRRSEWDLCAGVLLVEEAGGRITDAKGRPISFNRRDTDVEGVIAAPHRLHAQLLAYGGKGQKRRPCRFSSSGQSSRAGPAPGWGSDPRAATGGGTASWSQGAHSASSASGSTGCGHPSATGTARGADARGRRTSPGCRPDLCRDGARVRWDPRVRAVFTRYVGDPARAARVRRGWGCRARSAVRRGSSPEPLSRDRSFRPARSQA